MAMEKPFSRIACYTALMGVSVLITKPICADGSLQFAAMYVLGDPLVDDGNDNYSSIPLEVQMGDSAMGKKTFSTP